MTHVQYIYYIYILPRRTLHDVFEKKIKQIGIVYYNNRRLSFAPRIYKIIIYFMRVYMHIYVYRICVSYTFAQKHTRTYNLHFNNTNQVRKKPTATCWFIVIVTRARFSSETRFFANFFLWETLRSKHWTIVSSSVYYILFITIAFIYIL